MIQPARADHLATPVHNISIEFDLESNSFRGNSNIELPAGVEIQLDLSHLLVSQILVSGQPVETPPTGSALVIRKSASAREIQITYSKQVPPDGAGYDIISSQGITLSGPWHPLADREMIYKLAAYIPQEFEAVSEADEIITFQVENGKQALFRFSHPLSGINFVAGPYVVTREKFGGNKELAAYFFPEDQELAAGYLEKARQYLDRYEKMLGPYPYQRFAVVENRLPTGFAMPTFTLLGQAVVRLPFIVDTSLGHEVLHAWFGNSVHLSSREGNWVEGLTTYLADQAFTADLGNDTAYRKEQLVKYQSFVRPDLDLTLRDFSNVGHSAEGSKPVRAVGYNKSSMFFHMLRLKLGDETFSRALQEFYQRFKYKTAGWTDLQASFESAAGVELEEFFAQWLDRNDVPRLVVQGLEVSNDKGFPLLSFEIRQENEKPYNLELPVIISGSAEQLEKTLTISEPVASFEIPLKFTPEKLVIDPGYDIMRTLATSEIPATWSLFLGAQKKIAILASEEHRTMYSSLLERLVTDGVRVLLQDEVTDKELAANSLLFLGADGRVSRSLFAEPDHPGDGFTLDARKNPLNREQVAVLVSASAAEQVAKSAVKLSHYEKYSYLSFLDGRIREKKIAEAETGLQVLLVSLPGGMETSRSKSFDDIIAKLLNYQVIYVGEGHTNYEDHLLQLEIIRAIYRHVPKMTIGMEMFTRETQPVLDRYLAGELDEKTFLKESHYFKIWRFDYRLYRDIISFAQYNNIPVVGLNLERDIVSQVFKEGGTNSLPAEDIDILPENRKLDIPGYSQRVETAFMMHGRQDQGGGFSGFLQAQALWDETMAETITDYLEEHPDMRMVIIAGRGHVDKLNAIPPRVARRLPVSQAVVVNSLGSATETDTADFVFFAPSVAMDPFPLLGVMLEDIEDSQGVLVKALNPKGQAKEAGIRANDVILAIGPETVNDNEDVKIAMLYQADNHSVTVRIKRERVLFGDRIMDIEVSLKDQTPMNH